MPTTFGLQVKGFDKVQQLIVQHERQLKPDQENIVEVGFTQTYALIVHEDMEMNHEVGQAKYLEQPSRVGKEMIGKVIATTISKGGSIQQGLEAGGRVLEVLAKELTPVDTGALRLSTYVAPESSADEAAKSAFDRSEAHRLAVLAQRQKEKDNKP